MRTSLRIFLRVTLQNKAFEVNRNVSSQEQTPAVLVAVVVVVVVEPAVYDSTGTFSTSVLRSTVMNNQMYVVGRLGM